MRSWSEWTAGRLNRKVYWLGAVCVLIAYVLVNILLILLGLTETQTTTGMSQVNDAPPVSFINIKTTVAPIPAFIISVIVTAPLLVLNVRRRHDRGGSGRDVIAFAALGLLVQFFSLFGGRDDFIGSAMGLISLALFAWAIGLFVVLACLKGTDGPNKYGPDPLDPSSAPVVLGTT